MAQSISLRNLTKSFTRGGETFQAVDALSLEVHAGELVAFLGPSGCGKTTILRIIAGFERPTEGQVLIEGRDITDDEPNKRGIGFIFQNYALFPHMNVFENVAYGLNVRRESRKETERRVSEVLELVGLKGAERQFPNRLSGGEQQRVALARVFVIDPKVLLMDEPLANLDAKLRIVMLAEIRRLQKRLGATCVFVTHDQKEALAIADRIVVLNRGKVEQVGTPFQLYANPASCFVADFIGQANIFTGRVVALGEGRLEVSFHGRRLSVRCSPGVDFREKTEVALAVRPDFVRLVRPEDSLLSGKLLSGVFLGDTMEYTIETDSGFFVRALVPFSGEEDVLPEGATVGLKVDPQDVLALPL
jgi:iron(III) transport system ATP-binding protein